MNKVETAKILTVLRAAYPQFYSRLAADEVDAIIALWHRMFVDKPYSLVSTAVEALISARENNYPPSIGELNAEIQRISAPEEMTELEAWHLVAKATENAGYESKAEFDKLPETVRRLVGSPNQLREWSMMDSDVFNSVIASNFQRSYRARVASDRAYQSLPASTRAYMAQLADGLSLELPEPDTEQAADLTPEVHRRGQLQKLMGYAGGGAG